MAKSRDVRQNEFRLFLVGTEFFRPTGGIQYVNRLLLRAFLEFARKTPMRMEVFAYGDVPGAARPAWCQSDAVEWHAFGRQPAAMVPRLGQRLAQGQPHLALFTHVHLLRLAPLAQLLAPGTRRAVLGHGVEVWEPLRADILHALHQAQAVVAPSAFTRQRLIERNGAAPERVSVIAHGLDPEWAAERRTSHGTKRSGHTLLSVTRLDRADAYKGIDEMIRAMPAVLERCPEAQYVIAGDGNDRGRLEGMARKRRLGERVRFLGEVRADELRRLYATADVFVLPSRKEGFGIVFLEAMWHGLPVVAARTGGTTDVVEDGVTGVLVPPENPVQLVHAVSGLLLLPEERTKLGQAGRRRVEENYLFEHFAKRWQRWLAMVVPEAIYLARHTAAFAARAAARGN